MAVSAGLTFKVTPSFRELNGRFAKAEKELLAGRVPMMQTLAKNYLGLVGEEAPGGSGHTTHKAVSVQVFTETEAVGFRTMLGKVAIWQSQGTGLYGPRHALIRPRHASVLRFSIGGTVLYRAWVRGVHPNAFLGRAYRRWLPGAKPELRKLALNYSASLQGKTKSGQI